MKKFVLGFALGVLCLSPVLASGKDLDKWEVAFFSYANGLVKGKPTTSDDELLRESTKFANKLMLEKKSAPTAEEFNKIFGKVSKGTDF